MFSCTKVTRNKLHSFSKISVDVISLLYFKMSLHGHFFNFLIEEVLLGWRGCWVKEISWFASHDQFPGRLATQGHLCVFHSCCLTHQLGKSDLCQSGLVQVFGGCIPPVPREISRTVVHPSLLGSAMVHVVLLDFSLRCAFGGWWNAISAQIALEFMWNVSIHSRSLAMSSDGEVLLHG